MSLQHKLMRGVALAIWNLENVELEDPWHAEMRFTGADKLEQQNWEVSLNPADARVFAESGEAGPADLADAPVFAESGETGPADSEVAK